MQKKLILPLVVVIIINLLLSPPGLVSGQATSTPTPTPDPDKYFWAVVDLSKTTTMPWNPVTTPALDLPDTWREDSCGDQATIMQISIEVWPSYSDMYFVFGYNWIDQWKDGTPGSPGQVANWANAKSLARYDFTIVGWDKVFPEALPNAPERDTIDWTSTNGSGSFNSKNNDGTYRYKISLTGGFDVWPHTDGVFNNAHVHVLCNGTKPTAIGNLLGDGDMEQQPVSSFWFPGRVSDSGITRTQFGRIDSSNLLNWAAYGSPLCGNGMQIIGNSNPWVGAKGSFADIRQGFYWPATGVFYYRFGAKAYTHPTYIKAVLKAHYGSFAETVLFDGLVGTSWEIKMGSVPVVTQEWYDISFGLGSGAAADDVIGVDDVVVSLSPTVGVACVENQPIGTGTPTMTPTGNTPTATATGPTPTPSKTPTLVPTNVYGGGNYIKNCGFRDGEDYWNFSLKNNRPPYTYSSYVIYDINSGSTMMEGNYAVSEGGAVHPGIWQSFYWPGGTAYIQFWADAYYNVQLIDSATGVITTVTQGAAVGQVIHQATINLASGTYNLALNEYSGYFAEYDNVTIAQGYYGECPQYISTQTAIPNKTPTPIPSATVSGGTSTMIPTATHGPTSTTGAGTPTSTPRPTYTPWPTYTPPPAATRTVTPIPTYTPYPTYTQQPPLPTYTRPPTWTPAPSNTPNPQGTIETSTPPPNTATPTVTPPIPSPQPPSGYYSECQRPQTYDPVAFTEYENCMLMNFLSWSPRASGTLVAMGTAVSDREPFGTIGEMNDTQKQMTDYIKGQDWSGQGISGGQAPDPNTFLQPGADNPWYTGHIQFNSGDPISTSCSNAINAVLGPYITPGYCWMVNFLRVKGISPWLQLLVDIGALVFLFSYLIKKWIDAGSNA